MRSLMCLLFLVIFCSVQMTSSAVISIGSAQYKCCGEEFTVVKIPVKLVKSYSWTSSTGREFCVDPESTWVKSYIDKVDKSTTVSQSITDDKTMLKIRVHC
uniref:Chemokine interleukin-8-like domain-containing protein n=1 Tax=Cyprinus carpio TaxID=7962 RepID=A0A8C2KKL2_CYPCA